MSHTFKFTTKFIAACALSTMTTAAFSHVTLEKPSVEAASYTKAVLKVGHGCEGLPTAAFRVQIPDGFQGAKPMPKAGWTLAIERAKLAKPYDNHGKTVTEDVAVVTWTANSPEQYLADDQYDEFALQGRTPDAAGPLWFKALQSCKDAKDASKTGKNDWAEVPASGTSTKGIKFPAALMDVKAGSADAGHKH